MGALATAAAVVALLAQPAAAREIPLRKAHAVAAAKLLEYASTFTYVTDYGLTRCSRSTGRTVVCEYEIARYTGETCTGTLVVSSTPRGPAARLKSRCSFSEEPPPPANPPPTPPPTPSPPSPGPSPPPSPGYTALGDIHSVDTVAADGSTVVLEDGSVWTVDASYRGEAASWGEDDDVDVEASPGSSYTLTDDDAESSIVATFAGFQS